MQRKRSRIHVFSNMATTAVLLAALGSACVRPTPAPGLPSAALPAVQPTAEKTAADRTVEPAAKQEPKIGVAAPIPMKPISKPETAAATTASAASSLGGHDRHFVLRPLDAILAEDFELGTLASNSVDPGLRTALETLERGLIAGTLPYELFSNGAAAITRVIYAEPMLRGIVAARFSAPRTEPGGIASIGIRVFARRASESGAGSSDKSTATGLALLAQADAGAWRVEHFELDVEALKTPLERIESWDPYSTPQKP
ncbi:MAG: hypothetical protein A2Y38_09055 [Spirochaetes bacterium GWB1_59_5]|nr:MAG: hypothetical protein A2Y38_09055 [Spirochaetes bacterium GWB1_59_5]